MRLKMLFFLTLGLLLFHCNEDNVSQDKAETQTEIDARTISSADVEAIVYTEFNLSADAQKAVTDWQKYKDLKVQVENLKKPDFSFFADERTSLLIFINDLKTEMPNAIKTKPILARFTAFDTKLQKFNSILRLNTSTKTEKLEGIQEFFISFSNLNLQINKKLEFEKNNVSRPNMNPSTQL